MRRRAGRICVAFAGPMDLSALDVAAMEAIGFVPAASISAVDVATKPR